MGNSNAKEKATVAAATAAPHAAATPPPAEDATQNVDDQAEDAERVAERVSAAGALAATSTIAANGAAMPTSLVLEFIASCVEAGVDTASFDSYRAFVEAVDTDQDGNVSRDELYEWLLKSRGTFSTAQIRTIRVVMDEPRYAESKYGMGPAWEDEAASQRSDAAADVADEALASGLRMSTAEIFDFIDAAVAAGVDAAAFDTQHAFLAAADKDGSGTVDRGELKAWIDESENRFTKEQIELIQDTLKRGKRRDTGGPYSEGKFGMYM